MGHDCLEVAAGWCYGEFKDKRDLGVFVLNSLNCFFRNGAFVIGF